MMHYLLNNPIELLIFLEALLLSKLLDKALDICGFSFDEEDTSCHIS